MVNKKGSGKFKKWLMTGVLAGSLLASSANAMPGYLNNPMSNPAHPLHNSMTSKDLMKQSHDRRMKEEYYKGDWETKDVKTNESAKALLSDNDRNPNLGSTNSFNQTDYGRENSYGSKYSFKEAWKKADTFDKAIAGTVYGLWGAMAGTLVWLGASIGMSKYKDSKESKYNGSKVKSRKVYSSK